MHSTGTSIVLFFLCTINHSYYLVLTGKWKGVSWKIGVCVNVRTSCYAVPEMLIHIGWISIDFLQQPQHTRLQRNTNAQPWSQMRASLPWKIKLYNKKQSNAWPYAYCTKKSAKSWRSKYFHNNHSKMLLALSTIQISYFLIYLIKILSLEKRRRIRGKESVSSPVRNKFC